MLRLASDEIERCCEAETGGKGERSGRDLGRALLREGPDVRLG